MSRRERILLIVAAVLVVFVGWYFYIYSPRQAEYTQLTQDLKDRQNQLTQMENTARQITRLEQDYRQLQSFIASIEAKLPTTKEIPSLMVRLERLTKSLGISLQAIRPGQMEAVTPTSSSSSSSGGSQQPAPPAGASPYFKFPIKLSFIASYSELLRLSNSYQSFPRLIVVRRITMAPRTLPDLISDMDIETFVLPKEAR